MPILTEPFGRRRLEITPDRVAVHRPGAAGLGLLRDDGHVLKLSRRGRWLVQSGTFSARPGRIRVDGFDTGEIHAACLATGWDWKTRRSSVVEKGTPPAERARRPPRTLVTRRWSLVKRPKWPHVRKWLRRELTLTVLLMAMGWCLTWGIARLGWTDAPWTANETAQVAFLLLFPSTMRAVSDYRKGWRDDTVRVSGEEVVWHAAQSAAFVGREQVRTVVADEESLRFAGADGDVARLGVPPGQGDLAEALAKHGWPIRYA